MPARRLLMDLTAEENQVYLFMVLFGSILFGTPPLIKLYKYCRPHAAASRDPSAALKAPTKQPCRPTRVCPRTRPSV